MNNPLHPMAISRFVFRATHPPELVVEGDHWTWQRSNTDVRAGQPMVYFCQHCHWPTDIKDEQWFFTAPRDTCGECEGLIRAEILVTAQRELDHLLERVPALRQKVLGQSPGN